MQHIIITVITFQNITKMSMSSLATGRVDSFDPEPKDLTPWKEPENPSLVFRHGVAQGGREHTNSLIITNIIIYLFSMCV